MKILALKIYTDTQRAYLEGVPRLLDILDELRAFGSFFFGMGTESAGGGLRKLFGEGNAIVEASPGILRSASKRGQDCGIYGWDPQAWETRLDKMRDTALEADIKRAVESFTRRTGVRPSGFAAPGWQVNYMSLRVQDTMHFKYCSDTFGFYPYLPKLSWKTFTTPQIPDTLPPIEVALKGASGDQVDERLRLLEASLPEGLAVLPMNSAAAASKELRGPLRDFLFRCRDAGVKFMDLASVAKVLDLETLPVCEIAAAKAQGLPRTVATQSVE